MKRIIVDYSSLTDKILDLLVRKFPDGYDYKDIISFKNAEGQYVKAVEVRTEEVIYLVKISSKLEEKMEDYSDDDFDDYYSLDDPDFINI